MIDVNRYGSMQIGLASPERILEWSYGEVTKPETINYRSLKPEPDGLFCERIFGPSKDFECHCGRYKKIRYQGMVCEKCGVEITTKSVRRERMGHIKLATPVVHIWYLKGIPCRIGMVLDVSPKALEEVVYFISNIVLDPGNTPHLSKCEVLDEKTARMKFAAITRDILAKLDPESSEYAGTEMMIEKMENIKEPFEFIAYASYISRHTGAKFGTGAEAIKQLLSEVDIQAEYDKIEAELKETVGKKNQRRQKLLKRLDVIDSFLKSNNKPEYMVLDVIPVIPPDLRPMLQLDGGRFATSDLNDLYRRVITRNTRLQKLIDINAPSVILMNEKRMLQESVDALIDNGRRGKAVTGAGGRALKSLSSALKGKQGRFRLNLLGKRVDYSGRSVIAVGPDLKMYQAGIPREMAVSLLRPFIAAELIKQEVATSHKQADRMISRYDEKVLDVLEVIIKEHPVLLNRAPTLHRLGIQAFEPKLVDGKAIRLHPLVCGGFNADFDGDQMAVHVPLSEEAKAEARILMLASNNILGPKDGRTIVTPSQDMVLGNFYITMEYDKAVYEHKAQELRENGEELEAEKYDLFAESEGKIFATYDQAILAYETNKVDLHNRIAVRIGGLNKMYFDESDYDKYLITTVGKLIFNSIMPSKLPYLNEPTKENLKDTPRKYIVEPGTDVKALIQATPLIKPFVKKNFGMIIDEVFNRFRTTETSIMLDKLKDLGFKMSTKAAFTISLFDITPFDKKREYFKDVEAKIDEIKRMYDNGYLTNEERYNYVIGLWDGVKNRVQSELTEQRKQDPYNPLVMISDSGARGSASHFTQLSGMRGLMANTSGKPIEIPVKSCFREGLTVSEYFISTHGTRKGNTDTALKTAESGYLTRRLVDVSHDVIIREEDCGVDHGFIVKDLGDEAATMVKLVDRVVGRFSVKDIIDPNDGSIIVKAGDLITAFAAKKIEQAGIKEVEVRSLFTCECANGVCQKCYGTNLATGMVVNIGEAVGTMAAQSIGEPGTQLTMRTFHTGGVAGSDITQGLPRVEELFEARNPKKEAVISNIDGKVVSIKEEGGMYEIVVANDLDSFTYNPVFGSKLLVKVGEEVETGQKLTEGSINPKNLLEVAGPVAVQNYILKEVNKIYKSQSLDISDKHIEVIVHQMLRKILVIETGDTDLVYGTKVSNYEFMRANREALLAGKRPAVGRQVLLGITKAALETESFLSAASFQETTKVLADAAIKGKRDFLSGLKENAIVGKLIPAGTGLKNFGIEETVEDEETEDEDFDFSFHDEIF